MAKLCKSCGGPLCPICGGCIQEGECGCHSHTAEVERLRAANQRLESYLNQIAGSAQEWDCNKLGGVNIQRKRWQRLGELARTALRR